MWIEGLSKKYGQRAVVDNLSLTIEAGTVFGFLGPNGSGKSTTIKMLCGLVRPTSGRASIVGHDVVAEGDAVRRSIGYMAQGFALYADLTVDENLEFYARAYGLGKRAEARKREVIETVGIGAYRRYRGGALSGGWQRRLALAAALIHDPPVVFLDEPTAGIDPVARRDLWDLLFRLTAVGKTFFVTTHYMDEAERCSSLAYIYEGRLLARGNPEEICSLPEVNRTGTTRYAIATDDVMDVFRRLHDVGDVQDATIFGRDIHIVVRAGVLPGQIARSLGLPLERISPIRPSLEDAFVALTRARAA